MSSNWLLDNATRLAQFAGDDCEIDFINRARGELVRQRAVRGIVFGNHHAAARVLVQSMNYSWPLLSADSGQRGAVMKQGINERAAAMAGAGMNHQARRLVDDD